MISLILRLPVATQVIALPEQAVPQAKQTLDEINASYPSEIMPNSRTQTSQKLLDVLCDDSAEAFTFPPSWTIMYMAKIIPVLYDENGDALNEPWQVIAPLAGNYIDFMNDDNEGNRPNAVFENHKFMGMPNRF